MKYLGVPQSGSHANLTASRNRFGQYYRNRAIPVNPATPPQSNSRTSLATFSNGWRTLDIDQQSAWSACAIEYPVVNSLGQTVVLSGHSMYIRVNTARVLAGLAIRATPVESTDWSDAGIVVTAAAGTPAFSVVFTPPTAGQALVFEFSQQRSVGRFFESDYRFIAAVLSSDTSPLDLLDAYVAKFGSLIGGKAIFARSTALNECGVYGPSSLLRFVVAD